MHLFETQCTGYVGMGAPVTNDVTDHRTLEIQQNGYIWISIELFKTAL